MALRIRRGTESQRTGQIFNSGEIVWTTDLQQLWVGDGVAQGGVPAVGLNITGYGLTYNTGSHKIEVSGLTTDDITQSLGANNRWFTTELAQDAVAPLFTGGTHTNISFQYDDALGKINATVTLDGAGINALQDDTTPTLGGDLVINGFNVTGTGDINITGGIDVTGTIASDVLNATSSVTAGSLTLIGSSITGSGIIPDASGLGIISSPIYLGSAANPNTLILSSAGQFVVFTGITNGTQTSSPTSRISRGSLTNPTTVLAGDPISFTQGQAFDGTGFTDIGGFGLFTDPDQAIATGDIAGGFGIVLTTKTSATAELLFNSSGVLRAPIMMPGSFTTVERDALTPAIGMMIYNTTANKFQGYQNTSGTTLQWVDLS